MSSLRRHALPRLTSADLEALAAPTAPTLSPSAPVMGGGAGAKPKAAAGTLGPRPPRPSRRTPAHRAADRAPVTSRRLRRFFNDTTLVAAAAEAGVLPTTRAEFRALFEPAHSTPLATLCDDAALAAAWAPFVDVDEEAQARLLRAATTSSGGGGNGNGGSMVSGESIVSGAESNGAAADKSAFGGDVNMVSADHSGMRSANATAADSTAAAAASPSPSAASESSANSTAAAVEMLRRVDGRIRYLFKVRAAAVRPIVKQVEDTVVGLEHGERVVLRLPGALSRMVAHGVAQFHSLGHRSLGVGADRVLVVCGKGRLANGSARLIDVLA